MPVLLENVGYDKFVKNEEEAGRFFKFLIDRAQEAFCGYRYIYLRHENGNIETNITLLNNEDKQVVEVVGTNIQCSNMIAWDLTVCGILRDDYKDYFSVVCSTRQGEGLAVCTIVCPDILPYIRKEMSLAAQVAGFPLKIDVFKTEEESLKLFPQHKGKKYIIADGNIMPIHFLCSHNAKNKDIKYTKEDEINIIKAKVKEVLSWNNDIIVVTVQTKMGDLPLYFNKSMVKDKEICVGDLVVCEAVISLDPTIFGREKALFDEQSIYEVFQEAVMGRGGERLENVLSDDCKYYSEWADSDKRIFTGKKEICDRISTVCNNQKQEFGLKINSRISKISKIKDKNQEHKFNVGQKCLLFTNHNDIGWECAFVLKIEDKKIKEIYITTDSNYEFNVKKEYVSKTLYERVEAKLKRLFDKEEDVITQVDNYIETIKRKYEEDVGKLAIKIAKEKGNKKYIKHYLQKNNK